MRNLVKVECDHSSSHVCFTYGGRFHKLPIENVISLEHNQCVSWYPKDVFKKFKYIYIDQNFTDYIKMLVPVKDLFSKTKLKRLAKTEEFINEKYTFFNYGYVRSLLNLKGSKDLGMSGLF